ncbi:hypothetical protein FRC09_011295 [Ceratobasidium sp. 395]|nr:hypothetical protein FRC09_011295 [Ceratobasidium sp. 395]
MPLDYVLSRGLGTQASPYILYSDDQPHPTAPLQQSAPAVAPPVGPAVIIPAPLVFPPAAPAAAPAALTKAPVPAPILRPRRKVLPPVLATKPSPPPGGTQRGPYTSRYHPLATHPRPSKTTKNIAYPGRTDHKDHKKSYRNLYTFWPGMSAAHRYLLDSASLSPYQANAEDRAENKARLFRMAHPQRMRALSSDEDEPSQKKQPLAQRGRGNGWTGRSVRQRRSNSKRE